ncbi:ectopic P granules protein 5 homolog [Parasteatoda tepidariorum]|uniref:ectopic P granules protein 5 homolog n=1 Tax=Parasteatoda tepidariorum TaxID=114398 RepID=UPI0039BD8562
MEMVKEAPKAKKNKKKSDLPRKKVEAVNSPATLTVSFSQPKEVLKSLGTEDFNKREHLAIERSGVDSFHNEEDLKSLSSAAFKNEHLEIENESTEDTERTKLNEGEISLKPIVLTSDDESLDINIENKFDTKNYEQKKCISDSLNCVKNLKKENQLYDSKIVSNISNECNKKLSKVPLNKLSLHDNEKNQISVATTENMYPNLKSILHREKLENIIFLQKQVTIFKEEYLRYLESEVLEKYQEFINQTYGVENDPLYELIHVYQQSRKYSLEIRSKIKCLNSQLKRKRESVWSLQEHKISEKGRCKDGYQVEAKYVYEVKLLEKEIFANVIEKTKSLAEYVLSDAFYLYAEQLAKLRIEQYLYNVTQNLVVTSSVTEVSPSGLEKLQLLKRCVTTIFAFQRQASHDKQFLEVSRKWIKYLVSILLQKGNMADNIFLLNHVIRCPYGIEKWASEFIQLSWSTSCTNRFKDNISCHCLYYLLLVLRLILQPAIDRDFFLKDLKERAASVDCIDVAFTVLDSDGEEEEHFELTKNWSDGDLVSLLNQISIAKMCEHILLNSKDAEVIIKNPSELRLIKIFAYSSALLEVLYGGLEALSKEEFPLSLEYICSMIRHIVCYISDHWTYCRTLDTVSTDLQAVFDKFFFSAVFKIFNFRKAKASSGTINCLCNFNVIVRFHNISIISDYSPTSVLIEELKKVESSDQAFFLHVYESIVISGNPNEDLLEFIVHELFQITFVEDSLHHLLKDSVIIFRSIIGKHPYLMSTFLKEVNQTDGEKIIKHATYVLEKISLEQWIPTPKDIVNISQWLLSYNLSMAKNHIARILLEKMNWKFSPQGDLTLPLKLHREIAVLVLQAYMKFDNNGNEWSVSRGLNQILHYTSLKSVSKEDEGFVPWAWRLLFSLKLHALDSKHPNWVNVYDGLIEIHDLPNPFEDLWLHPLKLAYESNHPAACYLMLVMTDIGHGVKKLMKYGLDCLISLINNQHYLAAIQSLYYVLPFFEKNSDELLAQTEFIKAMGSLMIADASVISKITGEAIVGAVLLKLASMIKHQIAEAGSLTIECALPLLKLWIKLLLKVLAHPSLKSCIKGYSKQIHYLLDIVLQIAFTDSYTRDSILDLLYTLGAIHLSDNNTANSSFWNKWNKNNDSNFFSILQEETSSEFAWLAFSVIWSESKQELMQALWKRVQNEIYNDDKISISLAIKKSALFLKIPLPTPDVLPIYRWSKQIIATPVSHPSLPIMWQQFFLLYFQRISLETQAPRSLGEYYFRTGNSRLLFERLKKCLDESVKFWLDKLQTTKHSKESENPEEPLKTCKTGVEKCKSTKEQSFNLELCRIFKGFSLWLTDLNLHTPNVCYSALDPKYCCERLQLIYNDDKELWFDLISTNGMQEMLGQKLSSWTVKKSFSMESFQSQDKNSFDRITRHLKLCNAKSFNCTADIEPPTLDIEEAALSSWDLLRKLIETNQRLIFEKAKSFTDFSNKLTQLNFDYENLVPQEYDIYDTKIEVKKECSKGINCSGPRHFKLKVRRYSPNLRIQEKLEKNQVDHRMITEQLLNFPMHRLCSASIHVENYIKTLSLKLKSAEGESAKKIREIGEALFYHELKVIDKVLPTVSNFSPSRQFFSTIIESLGKEFILGQASQLLPLATAIVHCENSGVLASNLLLPNIAPVLLLPDLYEIVTYAVTHDSFNSAFVLLSKIDIKLILEQQKPDISVRKKIFDCICSALFACGYKIKKEDLPFYEVLKKQYSALMLWMFPELFCDATRFCIEGMEQEKISSDIFYETICCTGCFRLNEKSSMHEIQNALKKFAQNMLLPPDQQIYVSSNPINILQVKDTLEFLHEKFERTRQCQVLDFYETHAKYIKPFGLYMALLNHSLLLLLTENFTKEFCSVVNVWKLISDSFTPWLHPTVHNSHLNFPWSDIQIENARYMFQMFTLTLTNLHELLQRAEFRDEESRNILSHCWTQYVSIYVKPGLRHYSISVCHSEYINLPWHQFYPDPEDIDNMCTVLQSDLYESKEFLAKISLKIPWSDLIKNIGIFQSCEQVQKILATLGKLLIISGLDVSLTQSNAHKNKIGVLEDLPWFILTLEDVRSLLTLYYSSYNPQNIIKDDPQGSPNFYILQFLKIICGMTLTTGDESFNMQPKQLIFFHYFSTSLSQDIIKKESPLRNEHNLIKILPELLSDIDNLLRNIKPDKQMSHALPLAREILGFLNNIPESSLEEIAVNSVVSWLKCHHTSPVLLPCLQTACQCLNTVSSAVTVAECCIVSRFNIELSNPDDVKIIWNVVNNSFQIQAMSRDEFINTCVYKNAFLTLYCHVLERILKSSTSETKKLLLTNIVNWIQRADLKNVKESDEGKCLLLWDKVLELSILLAYEDECQVVQRSLKAFCLRISLLGEDKTSNGILGAIGLGSSSHLSVNFRFVCRIISAFLLHQLPVNAGIRLEPMATGHMPKDAKKLSPSEPGPSLEAIQSLENLRSLLKNKSYSALRELVSSAIEYILNSNHCLSDSRQFLRSYSLLVFPKQTFLYSIGL